VICVHSLEAARIVDAQSGRRATLVGPLAVPIVVARPTERRLLVSCGIVADTKNTNLVVDAFCILSTWMPEQRLAFVGPCGPDQREQIIQRANAYGTAHRVLVTGEVDEADYTALVGSAAVAVQLRASSHGESSAAVNDALAAGVPTVVTNIGSFAEFPDSVVVKVSADESAQGLAELLASLLTDQDRRSQLVESSLSYAASHSFASAARALVQAVLY
jgi:glycosyltransferase involved in cell wall biosynthesis